MRYIKIEDGRKGNNESVGSLLCVPRRIKTEKNSLNKRQNL